MPPDTKRQRFGLMMSIEPPARKCRREGCKIEGRTWTRTLNKPSWRSGHGWGAKHPPLLRDAQSDVRSLPWTARGWKMRQQRPDIKGRPSAGVNVQKKLAKVIKTHLWTQASAASHTVSYYWHPVAAINQHGGKNTVCEATACARAFTLGDTSEVSEKWACQH